MIDAPQIIRIEPQLMAAIYLTIPRNEIQRVMGPGLSELMSMLGAQGVAPTGRWLTHHFKMQPGTFDFEICVPVAAPVKPSGRVINSSLPAMTVARALYRGSYDRLAAAWPELDAWVHEQRKTPAADLIETYLVDPSMNPDPASWVTELTRPLV